MKKIGKLVTGFIPRGGNCDPKKVPFKQILPLSLRTTVSGKGGKSGGAHCIQEISTLFSCLSKNDFKEEACAPEIKLFKNCYSSHSQQRRNQKEIDKKGILIPGATKLSCKQASDLLKRFPN